MRSLFSGLYKPSPNHPAHNDINVWAHTLDEAKAHLKSLNLLEAEIQSYHGNYIPNIIGMRYLLEASYSNPKIRLMAIHEATFLCFLLDQSGKGRGGILPDDGLLHSLIHAYLMNDQEGHCVTIQWNRIKVMIEAFEKAEEMLPHWPKGDEQLGYYGFIPTSFDDYNKQQKERLFEFESLFQNSYNKSCKCSICEKANKK